MNKPTVDWIDLIRRIEQDQEVAYSGELGGLLVWQDRTEESLDGLRNRIARNKSFDEGQLEAIERSLVSKWWKLPPEKLVRDSLAKCSPVERATVLRDLDGLTHDRLDHLHTEIALEQLGQD